MNGTLRLVASSLVLALASLSPAGGAEYLRYAPEPSDGKPLRGPDEGVLVKRITIEKGDTLYALSRKFSGRGSYFSQILLFNDIENPDLIYAGKRLLVPLSAGQGEDVVPGARRAGSAAKGKGEGEGEGEGTKRQAVTPKAPRETTQTAKVPATPVRPLTPAVQASKTVSPPPAPRRGEETEQILFEKGVSTYKSGQYQQSLDAFDRFLARYPSSPLVPDATLYRADALMKLAGQ